MAAATTPLKSAPNITPSPSPSASAEHELIQHVRTLISRSRDHSRSVRSKWPLLYKILHNASYGTKHPYMPTTEIPEIFPVLQSIVGWMTDTRPEFNVQTIAPPFSPFADQFSTLAEDLDTALDAAWTMHDYDAAVERVAWDALSYGVGIFKAVWDGTYLGGVGNPRLSRVDPFTFFPDPVATNTEDGDYYGEVYRSSIAALDRRFPGAASKLTRVTSNFTEPESSAPTRASIYSPEYPRANVSAISGTPTRFGLPGEASNPSALDHHGLTVIEMWLREHEHVRDESGRITGTLEDWRFVVIAGDRVIVDRMASTFTESRRHPYERFIASVDEGEFFGQSLVELLAPLQISLNRLYQHTEHNVWLMGNPILKESRRAGTSRMSIMNRSGTRIPVNDGAELGWMDPPRLDANLVPQLIQFLLGRLESASGLSAINRGSMPGGRPSQGAVDTIAESAFVRIRLAQRQLERTLGRVGNLIGSYITEYYDEPRLLAVHGPDDEGVTKIFKTLHFYSPQPNEDGDRLPLRFQLQVDAGSSLPTSRSARIAEADTLFAMGALTIEAVLEAHKYKGRQRIAKQKAYENASGASSTPSSRSAARA